MKQRDLMRMGMKYRSRKAKVRQIDTFGLVCITALAVCLMILVLAKTSHAETETVKPIPQTIIVTTAEETEEEIIPIEWDYNISYGEPNAYEKIWDAATEEEKELVALILALEAQTEPFEGQKAAVEVILNRVASEDPYWPDTIKGVLSQKGQFATWKYRNKPYNRPTEEQYKAIKEVISAGHEVLPEDYVFFARSRANGKDFIKIGHHYFSRSKR